MTRFLLPLLAICMCPALTGNALANSNRDENCAYVNRNSACTEAERRKLNTLFGLPSIENMHGRAARADRRDDIMIGIGRFKLGGGLAVLIMRDRDGIPWIEVRETRQHAASKPRKPMRAQISESLWHEMAQESRALDIEYYDDRVCVGGGIFTAQASDPEGNIRARVGAVCGDDPAIAYFIRLADTAINASPDCQSLAVEVLGSTIEQLRACFALSGDKIAAGELYSQLHSLDAVWRSFWTTAGRADPGEIAPFLDADVQFVWPGMSVIQGRAKAADFWTDDRLFAFDFNDETYHAVTVDRVTVTGGVITESENGDIWRKRFDGQFSAVWIRNADGVFKLRRFTYSGKRPR